MHTPTRLLVTDWTLDPHAVVAACSTDPDARWTRFALLVPAWLHGLDWAGDPGATVPCAEDHLAHLEELLVVAGIEVAAAAVADPDPATAVADAVADWQPADIILVLPRRRLVPPNPLDLRSRVARLTGLPVSRIDVPVRTVARRSQRRCQPIPVPGGAP